MSKQCSPPNSIDKDCQVGCFCFLLLIALMVELPDCRATLSLRHSSCGCLMSSSSSLPQREAAEQASQAEASLLGIFFWHCPQKSQKLGWQLSFIRNCCRCIALKELKSGASSPSGSELIGGTLSKQRVGEHNRLVDAFDVTPS